MTDDGPSSEATLLSLPPEVLTEIVARCGRSVKCPRANPSALLSSCRTLQELGRSAAVRVDFLIAVFGTRFAIEGACMWLPLLRRDVLQGLLRRIEGASHPVPRYQLQRLFHRCTNANRTDLLLEVLVFAEQLYPPPSTKTISRKETQFPDIALGFQVRFTDDDLFEDLVFANPNAMGTAEKDKQWAHLVKEGKNAGWQVAGDRPMTALLTLKNKHGLNPNLSIAGLTSNSLALAPKRLGFYRQEEPAPIFDTDCSIEGLSLGYALLIRAIDTGNERAVRRLLSLGTSVVAEDDSFFWQVIRHVREDDDLELAYKSTEGIGKKLNEDAVAQYPRTNYALRALGFPIGGAYFPVDDFAKVFHFLGEFYQVLEKMEHCQIPNALLHIAKSQTATIEILRTVLSMLQESGWLATPAGRKALAEARDTCLEKNDVRYYELFHSYASSVGDEGEECNLFIILVRGQIDSAKKLVERGERLTPEQIVSLLNTTNGLPETMDFMVERYPYDHDVLQRVVSDIFGKLDDRNLPIVDSLLKAQGHFFSDRSGRERLLKELETSYSKKQFVRTLLGPLNESGENSPIVLRYDMELALQSRDLDKIKKLVKLGAVVPPNQVNRLLRNTKGNETIDFSGVIANDRYTAKELGEIVFEALLSRRWNLVDELLDNKGGVEPEINNRVLNQCMQLSKHERAFDAFKALLDVAGRQRQTKVAKGRKSAEQAGPLWLAEWEKFEKRVEERTK